MVMDLRHLRHFVAVAEEGHITRAAVRLGMQQPPLSQSIRALEDELELQLFRRKPRGVELTDAGQSLLVDAQAVLAQVERALTRAQRTARGELGRIVIGFTSSAPIHPFVPRAIRLFRENHPRVSVVLEESGTGDLVAALRTEQLDAAFVRSPIPEGEGVSVHELLEEQMYAALPSGHRLAGKDSEAALPLAELAAESFVLYRRASGPGLHDAIVGALSCRRISATDRTGSPADHRNPEPRCRRVGRDDCAGIPVRHAAGRDRLSPPFHHPPAGRADPAGPPQHRPFAGGPAVRRDGTP